MTALRIIYHIATPRLDHAGQYIGKLRPADTHLREYFGVVAADVLDNVQWFASLDVDQQMFGFLTNLFPVVEDNIGSVRQTFRFLEFAAGGFVQVFAGLLLHLREVVPQLQRLGIDPERGDAGGNETLVSGSGHQRELTRYHRHDGLQRYHIPVVADTGAGGVVSILVNVSLQIIADNVQKCSL